MEKIINYENLRNFAYVNAAIVKQPIKGIVIWFNGLGYQEMQDTDEGSGEFYAKNGILYVDPYNNPWSWMNSQAVAYTDEIVDVLVDKFNLPDNIPIISTGLSMGGQAALVYSVYSKRQPAACVANCPVCDVVFHFTERKDLPRTLYSSVFNETGTLEDALKAVSPLHLVERMPKIKYHIFHCDKDEAVNIDSHSRKFVNELQKRDYDVTFDIAEGKGHCDLTPELGRKWEKYIANILNIKGD